MAIKFYQAKTKWLLLGVDKPSIQNELEFTEEITNVLNIHNTPFHENILILRSFKITTKNVWVQMSGYYMKCNTVLKRVNEALQEETSYLENDANSTFNSGFANVLNKHAPLKTKIRRYSTKTFMAKEPRKEIMKKDLFIKDLYVKDKDVTKIVRKYYYRN